MDFVKKCIVVISTIVLFFPFLSVIEPNIPKFYIAFLEETTIRFIPFVLVYYIYRQSTFIERLELGIVGGLTFGILELCVKILAFGFNSLMLLPLIFVHIVNGIIMSEFVGDAFENKSWLLLPIAWILCSLWHSAWNCIVGFV